MPYHNMKEEELKNRIARDFFWQYDWTKIIGNVDFCVSMYDKKKWICISSSPNPKIRLQIQ